MLVAEIKKEPWSEFGYGVRYHKVLAPGEKISSCDLQAIDLSDDSDVSATFLADTSATIPGDTATGGSTTTLVNTGYDHADNGIKVGDWLVNTTKGWSTRIKEIITGTNPNDTLVFEAQSVAAAASDVYTVAKAIASIKAGSDGERIKVRFRATTSRSRKFEDDVIVTVEDE